MKRNDKTRGHKNRKMNDATYLLRRKVIDIIYQAKRLDPKMPRVDVRITDCERHKTLGTARTGDCIVWIPVSSTKRKDLRHIVFHELLHAAYGQDHVRGCPLMAPVISATTKSTQDKLFLKYANK